MQTHEDRLETAKNYLSRRPLPDSVEARLSELLKQNPNARVSEIVDIVWGEIGLAMR